MADIAELLAQKEAIEKQIEELRKSERLGAIARVKSLIADFGLTVDEIFGRKAGRAAKGAGGKGVPKYRDPATGKTWTGHGRPPGWLDGKNRDDFLIG